MRRRGEIRAGLAALASAGLLAGALAPAAGAAPAAPRAADFAAAAARHGVPEPLLLAMGWTNTHWRMPAGPSLDGGWGAMHLSARQVRAAAASTHRSPRALRRDARANLDGGAALLAAAAHGHPRTLAGWRPAVARLGGRGYAGAVYATLAHGASSGRIVLTPHPAAVRAGAHASQAATPGEEAGTTWVPASKAGYSVADRPYDQRIDTIVIHETQGSYAGTVKWFQSSQAQASAAFVVRSSDGAITQMVHEKDVAWHAGNHDYNWRSIGIEHEGYVGDCTWNTDAMYRGSAQLVAALARKYAIPVDRAHIIGHSEVPDPNHAGLYGGADHHTDPGACWNWDYYLSLVRADLGLAGPPVSPASSVVVPTPGYPGYSQVVDNGTRGRFKASRSWKKSRVNHKAYLRGYFVTTARPRSDAARYKLTVPTTGDYTLYARWPASRTYSSSVPVAVQTTSGVQWAHVNERHHGGAWRKLGTYQLPAGDSWAVQFSRWTKAKGTIVADAVRIRSAP
jgi:hypothetical protein